MKKKIAKKAPGTESAARVTGTFSGIPAASAGAFAASPAREAEPSAGARSRTAILLAAAQLATVKGLQGLSIGELAAHLDMSKSGLYAHFKSKEALELATIDTAVEIFQREVIRHALAAPAGKPRLLALVEAFLSHVRRRVFPGGCFFAATGAELAARAGPAHDRLAEIVNNWLGLIEQCLRDAQAARDVEPQADVSQLAFEIESMLLAGNLFFTMTDDENRLKQARAGIEGLLRRVARRA